MLDVESVCTIFPGWLVLEWFLHYLILTLDDDIDHGDSNGNQEG